MPHDAEPVIIENGDTRVSGLLQVPARARALYVFAHGAGAGMAHPFMTAVATELSDRGIATLRYQFPYMEARARRPDPPKVAHAAVLCPSFYRAEVIQNPNAWDRFVDAMRRVMISLLQSRRPLPSSAR